MTFVVPLPRTRVRRPVLTGPRSVVRSPATRALVSQFAGFVGIGVLATVLQLALYAWFRDSLGPYTANLLAMTLSTLVSIEGNRRVTFHRHGLRGATREYLGSLAVFALGLALTSATLGLLDLLTVTAGRDAELAMIVVADALVGLIRFGVLRCWVFHSRGAGRATG